VIGASIDTSGPLDTVIVDATEAKYDEIYESADISFHTEGACESGEDKLGADKDECVGWNSDCTSGAKAVLPLFSNNHTTLSCDDCFVDMHVDVFIDVSISGFEVKNLSAGFRNMYGALDFISARQVVVLVRVTPVANAFREAQHACASLACLSGMSIL
jgi:hypothetical protein